MIDDAMGMDEMDTGAAKQFDYNVSKSVKASAARAGKGERACETATRARRGAAGSRQAGRGGRARS